MVYASALNHYIISKPGCVALLSITCVALPNICVGLMTIHNGAIVRLMTMYEYFLVQF